MLSLESTSPLNTDGAVNPPPAHWTSTQRCSLLASPVHPSAPVLNTFALRLLGGLLGAPSQYDTLRVPPGAAQQREPGYMPLSSVAIVFPSSLSPLVSRAARSAAMPPKFSLVLLGYGTLLARAQTLMLSACTRIGNEQ